MKRADLIDSFKNSFPKVDQTSMSGMILFQGFCAGLNTGAQQNLNDLRMLRKDIVAKDASIDTLTAHIASLNQYLKAQDKSLNEKPDEESNENLKSQNS